MPVEKGHGATTRSEEELHVATVRLLRARVRLLKYVVTEMVTTTVPVRREEVRIERVPIADVEAFRASPDGQSEEVHEVVLHEERLVIEKRVVPVERVRMRKETVTEQRSVSNHVRKERIEPRARDAIAGGAGDT